MQGNESNNIRAYIHSITKTSYKANSILISQICELRLQSMMSAPTEPMGLDRNQEISCQDTCSS